MGQDGHLIGYARTSTTDQQAGLEAQLRDLKAAGCRKIFSEQASSVGHRAQLEAALDCCREGDTLVLSWVDDDATADCIGQVEAARRRAAAELLELTTGHELRQVTPGQVVEVVIPQADVEAAA